MIFEQAWKNLRAPRAVIPVEDLLGNATGSRMPEVVAEELTRVRADAAVAACPTRALLLDETPDGSFLELDYGRCIGCGACGAAAPEMIRAARIVSHCGAPRQHLKIVWSLAQRQEVRRECASPLRDEAGEAARAIYRWMGRALNVRALDSGSCNGCEAELAALSSPVYDLERFGIQFVASPRHADLLLLTGPVTRNLHEAVLQTWQAMPDPKRVLAVGACACSGGLFAASPAVAGPPDQVIPVDGFVAGCPPTPAMILTGILRVIRNG